MTLLSLSPLDGRYASKLDPLRPYFSELALQKYRVLVELRFLAALGDEGKIREVARLSSAEKKLLEKIVAEFGEADGLKIKEIEKTTNHDVKAVEYFLQEKLKKTSLADRLSFLHFSLTSEDVNNLAYSLMLRDAMQTVLLPRLTELQKELARLARKWKTQPLLSRTHGQSATPTTVGKEFAVFAARLGQVIERLKHVPYRGKLSGATGTFAAQVAAYPAVDWPAFTTKFVKSLGLTPNLLTTQIESHDGIAELADTVRHANTIATDLAADCWAYISRDFFKLKKREGEVGSSTMPHKVNPIDFENAEGNFGVASALLEFFSRKLPISRLQRDLTDSTILRNLGVGLGHSYLGWGSLLVGLGKLELNKAALTDDLNAHPEILGEAIQTVLRRYGDAGAYEKLKALTRGQKVTALLLAEFVKTLELPDAAKAELLKLTPENYTGLAARLVEEL